MGGGHVQVDNCGPSLQRRASPQHHKPHHTRHASPPCPIARRVQSAVAARSCQVQSGASAWPT